MITVLTPNIYPASHIHFISAILLFEVDIMKKKTKTLLTVASVGLGVTAGYLLTGYLSLKYAFKRKNYKQKHATAVKHPLSEEEKNYIASLKQETLTTTSFDNLALKATFFPADIASNKVVICIHGYHSYGMLDHQYFIRFYHEHGFHVLIPDDRAHGDSEGEYIGFGYYDRLDIMQWIMRIQEYFDYHPLNIMLHGVSMGASAVLMASGEELSSDVKCIVADCGYASAREQLTNVLKAHHIPTHAIMSSASLLSKKVIGYDFNNIDVIKQVEKSHIPTLFIHGDQDSFVDYQSVKKLYEACHAPKELFIVPGAEHCDSYITDPKGYESHILNFTNKYFTDEKQ